MNKLSVIVPCYNCETTLEEAIASIYNQKEPPIQFDVTMVDDGSTDNTFEIMGNLSQKYPNIKLVRHETNLGGGAARNTAVEHSDGNIIFCLDSDDILGKDFLYIINSFWLEKRCDGVGISTSIKFNKTNIDDIAYITNFENPDQKVNFYSLVDSSRCSLFSTFLITRKAFNLIGGYPTDHGFDTQGIAFRFLCNGLTAYTCPNTIYHHRVNYHESYYLREAREGRLNKNWFMIFDEFIFIFKNDIKKIILEADIYKKRGKEYYYISRIIEHKPDVFIKDIESLIEPGLEKLVRKHANSNDAFWQYWIGGYFLARGSYQKAINKFVNALKLGFNFPIIYNKILRASFYLAGEDQPNKELMEKVEEYFFQPSPLKLSEYNSLKIKIKKIPIFGSFFKLLFKILGDIKKGEVFKR